MDSFLILKWNFIRESSKERLNWRIVGDDRTRLLDWHNLGTISTSVRCRKQIIKNGFFSTFSFSLFFWLIETLEWMQKMLFVFKSINLFSRFWALKGMSPWCNGYSGGLLHMFKPRLTVFSLLIVHRLTILFSVLFIFFLITITAPFVSYMYEYMSIAFLRDD